MLCIKVEKICAKLRDIEFYFSGILLVEYIKVIKNLFFIFTSVQSHYKIKHLILFISLIQFQVRFTLQADPSTIILNKSFDCGPSIFPIVFVNNLFHKSFKLTLRHFLFL